MNTSQWHFNAKFILPHALLSHRQTLFFLHFIVSNRSILLIILKSYSVLFQAPWLLKAKHLMNSCVALSLKRHAVSTTNAVQKTRSVALLRPRCLLIAAQWITQCARMESVIEHAMGSWSKESPSLKDLSHHDLFWSSIALSLKFTGLKMFWSVSFSPIEEEKPLGIVEL